MHFSQNEVEKLLTAPEGAHYEFKEAKNRFDFTEAAKYCCALSNCGGGKLILGISDKRPRKVVGSEAFAQPERTRKDLMDKLRVRIDFTIYEYEGKRILVFDIAGRPAGLPVQVGGIAWWRDGDSLVRMSEEKRREIYEETGHDFSADICKNATFEDLDENAIQVFRETWATKSENTRLQNMDVKQLLMDCGAITEYGITYAALILFGTRSALRQHLAQAEIVFEYRSSNASGPAQQREEFQIGFFACFDRVWELINLRNDKQHYQSGLFVFDVLTFNERAVREALLNAVCHRNYQMNGSIFVRQYRDRLLVESPGGFPHGITLDNILNRQAPKNRRIAEILARCGLVERSGQGMNLMYELCIREAKALPDFTGTDAYGVCLTLNGMVLDENMLLLIGEIGEEQLAFLSTDDFLVIDALFHGRKLQENLRPRIQPLVEMGLVERAGRNKVVLARSLYKAAGKAGTYTRRMGLDRETNKALIVKHIRESATEGAPLKELQQMLPSLSRSQIQVLLRELRKEGQIFVVGRTSAAKWFERKS